MTPTEPLSMRFESARFFRAAWNDNPRFHVFSHRNGVGLRWRIRFRGVPWNVRYRQRVKDRKNPPITTRDLLGNCA